MPFVPPLPSVKACMTAPPCQRAPQTGTRTRTYTGPPTVTAPSPGCKALGHKICSLYLQSQGCSQMPYLFFIPPPFRVCSLMENGVSEGQSWADQDVSTVCLAEGTYLFRVSVGSGNKCHLFVMASVSDRSFHCWLENRCNRVT